MSTKDRLWAWLDSTSFHGLDLVKCGQNPGLNVFWTLTFITGERSRPSRYRGVEIRVWEVACFSLRQILNPLLDSWGKIIAVTYDGFLRKSVT